MIFVNVMHSHITSKYRVSLNIPSIQNKTQAVYHDDTRYIIHTL